MDTFIFINFEVVGSISLTLMVGLLHDKYIKVAH